MSIVYNIAISGSTVYIGGTPYLQSCGDHNVEQPNFVMPETCWLDINPSVTSSLTMNGLNVEYIHSIAPSGSIFFTGSTHGPGLERNGWKAGVDALSFNGVDQYLFSEEDDIQNFALGDDGQDYTLYAVAQFTNTSLAEREEIALYFYDLEGNEADRCLYRSADGTSAQYGLWRRSDGNVGALYKSGSVDNNKHIFRVTFHDGVQNLYVDDELVHTITNATPDNHYHGLSIGANRGLGGSYLNSFAQIRIARLLSFTAYYASGSSTDTQIVSYLTSRYGF